MPGLISRSCQWDRMLVLNEEYGRQIFPGLGLVLLNCRLPLAPALTLVYGTPYTLNVKGRVTDTRQSSHWLRATRLEAGTRLTPDDWLNVYSEPAPQTGRGAHGGTYFSVI